MSKWLSLWASLSPEGLNHCTGSLLPLYFLCSFSVHGLLCLIPNYLYLISKYCVTPAAFEAFSINHNGSTAVLCPLGLLGNNSRPSWLFMELSLISHPTLLKPGGVFFAFVENIKSGRSSAFRIYGRRLWSYSLDVQELRSKKPNNEVINFTSTSSPFELVHRHLSQRGCRDRCASVRSGRSAPSVRTAVQHQPAPGPPWSVLFYSCYMCPLPDELCPNASIWMIKVKISAKKVSHASNTPLDYCACWARVCASNRCTCIFQRIFVTIRYKRA